MEGLDQSPGRGGDTGVRPGKASPCCVPRIPGGLSAARRQGFPSGTATHSLMELLDDAKFPGEPSEPGPSWCGRVGQEWPTPSLGRGPMSERVTWEQCPRCRKTAAVGWVTIDSTDDTEAEEVAEEYDCPSGCRLDPDELRRTFHNLH